MNLSILRIEDTIEGIIGVLLINKQADCWTLELPWRNNKKLISCIPCGSYILERVYSPLHGETFGITGVPDRDNILIHIGNWISDLEGCIALGTDVDSLSGRRAVINSRKAVERFLDKLVGIDSCPISITQLKT